MMILGEVALDEDGVLHGWCWSPDRPATRLTVDILIDDELVSSLVASRFREDLRHRKYGDGYHGFSITLTKQIAAASKRSVLSAREHVSGICFWHKAFGEFAIPEGFDDRLAAIRADIVQLSHSPGITAPPDNAKTASFATALGALGDRLRAHAGHQPVTAVPRPFALAIPAAPIFSVILDAGPDGAATFEDIRRAAPALSQAKAEIILTDDGTDPDTLQDQMQAQTLKYIFCPQSAPSSRRNLGALAARSTMLVFLNHARGRPGAALTALAQTTAHSIVISAELADTAQRIAPAIATAMMEIPAPASSGLALAMPSHFVATYGGFDTSIDDGAGLDMLDWVLRAAKAGAPVAIWRSPWSPDPQPSREQTNPTASHRFAERWMLQ